MQQVKQIQTYGKIGVKVWIYKGEIIPVKNTDKGGASDGLNAKRTSIVNLI